MISPTTHRLFKDLQPSGKCLEWDPALRNSIGSDTPRFSDERVYMDPWAAKYHTPKWCFAERVTIRQRTATISREVIFGPRDLRKAPPEHTRKNLVKGTPKGFIGRDAARRIRNMINDWTQAVNCGSKWSKGQGVDNGIYFAFATLTLPVTQAHDDKHLKQYLLNPFIKALVRDLNVVHYLWRAEPQRNGNIHFHIFIDQYIEHEVLSIYWEHSLEQLGYISAFYAQTGSFFPPSEHIVKVPREGQLRDYIAKYLSKAQAKRRSVLPASENDLQLPKNARAPKVTRISFWAEGEDKEGNRYEYEVRPIQGRVWGCSDSLRNIKPYNVLVSEVIGKWAVYMEKLKQAHIILKKFGTVMVGAITEHLREWDQWLWRSFYWWHVDQFRYLYCGQQERPPDRPETIREILLACCAGIRSTHAPAPAAPDLVPTPAPIQPQPMRPRSLDPILSIPF